MTRLSLLVCLCTCLVAQNVVAQSPLGPSPKAPPAGRSADDILPPAPPIPDPPGAVLPPAKGLPPTGPSPMDVIAPASPAPDADPFQQAPRDRAAAPATLPRASEEFANKHYTQAATLFAEADRHKEPFSPAQREEWAYCRLYAVAMRLNRGSGTPAELAQLDREVQEAQKMGPDRLAPFAKQLLDEIHKRDPALPSPVAPGWQCIELSSFRVMYQTGREAAVEVGRVAEAARVAMYGRWFGSAGGSWSPRCDIYLHATAADYAKATNKPAEQPGHSTVQIRGGRVASRRIDLHMDAPNILENTLPSEITQVLLADAFSEEPLPRWAVVGMAALSESPESVGRYQRAIPTLLKEQKLFAVGPFMERPGFPKPESVTAFYAESVSLVAYLVQIKGPKAFSEFLREAPRRGYAKALASHYGVRDAMDLQERWLRHAMGGQ